MPAGLDSFATLQERWPGRAWVNSVYTLAQKRLVTHPHGDLPRRLRALQQLPAVSLEAKLDSGTPALGGRVEDLVEPWYWKPWCCKSAMRA